MNKDSKKIILTMLLIIIFSFIFSYFLFQIFQCPQKIEPVKVRIDKYPLKDIELKKSIIKGAKKEEKRDEKTEYFIVRRPVISTKKQYPQAEESGIKEKEIERIIRMQIDEKRIIDIIETKDKKFISQMPLQVYKFKNPSVGFSLKPHLGIAFNFYLQSEPQPPNIILTFSLLTINDKYHFPSIGIISWKAKPLVGLEYKFATLYDTDRETKLIDLYGGIFYIHSKRNPGIAIGLLISKALK